MSIFNKVKEIYYKIPEPVLKVGGLFYYAVPERYRYGSDFELTKRMLQDKEFLTNSKLNEIINEKFVNTVRHAYYHVPFYKKLYDECGVDVDEIQGIKDITKLPLIDKDVVRNHTDEMIADDYDKRSLLYVTTSGSTGNPVGFYQPQAITMIEWAYTLHIWSRVGYKPDSSRLVLRGKKLHSGKDSDVFYDPLRKELSCNIFNMTDLTMEKYCAAIEKYRPEYIHGYMSAIIMLAKYIDKTKRKLNHKFRSILATSENIIDEQKKFVEKVFETRVFSFYGHSERLVIAGECEKSSAYHVEPMYGYAEIIPLTEETNKGEIVATGFLNNAMPLIRYRTGDIGVMDEQNVCDCRREYFRIKSVEGRWHQEMLINSEGAYVSMTALNIHSKEFDNIIRYKLIQSEKGIVDMEIQATEEFCDADSIAVKNILERKTNFKIVFHIKTVDEIPISNSGKYKIIEQKIPLV